MNDSDGSWMVCVCVCLRFVLARVCLRAYFAGRYARHVVHCRPPVCQPRPTPPHPTPPRAPLARPPPPLQSLLQKPRVTAPSAARPAVTRGAAAVVATAHRAGTGSAAGSSRDNPIGPKRQ